VAVFLLHGANFLGLKLAGALRERARSLARGLWLVSVVSLVLLMVATMVVTDLYTRLGIASAVVPLAAILALLLAGYTSAKGREGWAFVLAALAVILVPGTFFVSMFPRVMISSTNPDYSLTIYNASSSPYTLKAMSIVALIFIPIVLAYQIWSYWVFRDAGQGRARLPRILTDALLEASAKILSCSVLSNAHHDDYWQPRRRDSCYHPGSGAAACILEQDAPPGIGIAHPIPRPASRR